MDLKLDEVANLLKVSPLAILRWVEGGYLPGYKIHDEYHFSRNEIEKLLLSRESDPSISALLNCDDGSMKFDLFRAIFHGPMVMSVAGATKEEVITKATHTIAQELQLDHESLTSLLLEREAMMSTGLGSGIALPHTRDFLMESGLDIVSIVYTEEPIAFDSLDKKPVSVLFFLLASSDKKHLHLLAKIASFCQVPQNRDFLKTKPAHKEVLQLIRQWEQSL